MAYGYKQKEFNRDELFRQKYGTHASWADKQAFNKYWNSEQREADELAHINSEIAKSNEYWDGVVKQAINRTRGIPEPAPEPVAPQLYKSQNFEEAKMAEMYGTNPSKRDQRRFQDYLKSDEGQKAWIAFDQAEHQKWMKSVDDVVAYRKAQMQQTAKDFAASVKPTLVTKPSAAPAPAPAPTPVKKPTVVPRSNAEWARIAKENGFADMGEVMAWQEANGLEADGKFGKASSAFFKANGLGKYQKTPEGYVELSRQDGTTFLQRYNPKSAPTSTPAPAPATVQTPAPVAATDKPAGFDLDAFRKTQGLKSDAFVTHNGQKYLRYDPDDVGDFYIGEDGSMYRADWGGGVGDAIDRQKHLRYSTPNGTRWERNYNDVYNKVDAFKKATMNKQGGIMRINYFQQGGAAPQQQDIKAQVVALVQAAMQGDQKATQQVNQIMEAAKAGDQQAMQIAQIMEQVVKELQGQAVAAKYGAKLDYLQSLKCGGKAKTKKKEQGGKVCPACQGNS